MLLDFLKPFLMDKTIWLSLAGWVLALVNAKMGLGLDQKTLETIAAAASTFAVTHLSHEKTKSVIAAKNTEDPQ